VLRMAGWTAEGGALGRENGRRNKCYCTGLHTAERWVDRNKATCHIIKLTSAVIKTESG